MLCRVQLDRIIAIYQIRIALDGNVTFQGGKKDGHAIEDDGEE